MNLLNMLLGTLTTDNSVDALTEKTGADKSSIINLIMMVLPIIIKAMTNNTSSASGAESLLGALTQHTSRDAIDRQIADADIEDGAAIMDHILGANTASVTSGLAEQTGLSEDQVSTTLDSIAPAILSGISAATEQAQNTAGGVDLSDGFDLTDIMGLFTGGQTAQPQQAQSNQGGGLLSGLLGTLLGGRQEEAEPQVQQAAPNLDAMNMISGLTNLLDGDNNESSFNGVSLLSSLLK